RGRTRAVRVRRGHRRRDRAHGRVLDRDQGGIGLQRKEGTGMNSYKNFVNGKMVASVDGADEPIISPVDEKRIGKVPKGTAKDVDRAVDAAAAAFAKWQDSTPQDRSLMLLKLADRIEQAGDELAALEAANVGKPIGLAKAEIPFLVDNLRFFAGACRCLEGKAAGEDLAGYTSMIRREPGGGGGPMSPLEY